jgi:hypothetical protein
MTVAFGSFITINGDPHSNRILFRYFEFAILAIYLAAISLPRTTAIKDIKRGVALTLTLGAVLGAFSLAQGRVDVQPFDAITVAGFTGNPIGRWVLIVLTLSLFLLAFVAPKHVRVVSVITFIAIPAFATVTLMSGGRSELADFEVEARSQSEQLSLEEGLIVAGVDLNAAQVASFWIGNSNSSVISPRGTIFLEHEALKTRGEVVYLNDEVALLGSFQSNSFRDDHRVIDASGEDLEPLNVPGGLVRELKGIVATSSLGNWGDSSGLEVHFNDTWKEGQSLELSLLPLETGAEPIEIKACGRTIPVSAENDGVIFNITLTAPVGFACDLISISAAPKGSYLVLVAIAVS